MKLFELKRCNDGDNRIDGIYEIREQLRAFLADKSNLLSEDYQFQIERILDFQAEDGSFCLHEERNFPSDCLYIYRYEPTYMCSSILMNAALILDNGALKDRILKALSRSLKVGCDIGFEGHGYDWMDGIIKALNTFCDGGLNIFLQKYSDLCPEFTSMINNRKQFLEELIEAENFIHGFASNYEAKMRHISKRLTEFDVFVYGTLMKGESASGMLSESECLGEGVLEDHAMYDLGMFPGIVPQKGERVYGELYVTNIDKLKVLDGYEGEGSLYKRKTVVVNCNDEYRIAQAYVYLNYIDGRPKMDRWKMRD